MLKKNFNHIIQKFASIFDNKEFIFDNIIKDFNHIVTDKHGCCVLQKCIEVADLKSKVIPNLIKDENNKYGCSKYTIIYVRPVC